MYSVPNQNISNSDELKNDFYGLPFTVQGKV